MFQKLKAAERRKYTSNECDKHRNVNIGHIREINRIFCGVCKWSFVEKLQMTFYCFFRYCFLRSIQAKKVILSPSCLIFVFQPCLCSLVQRFQYLLLLLLSFWCVRLWVFAYRVIPSHIFTIIHYFVVFVYRALLLLRPITTIIIPVFLVLWVWSRWMHACIFNIKILSLYVSVCV